MARIYATEERSGKRVLLRLECDGGDCSATIKPHPDIAQSGWVVHGQSERDGFALTWDYCPRCKP